MPECLVLTSVADDFAAEIERIAKNDISFTTCTTPAQALAAYKDQEIMFGNPAMIAEVMPHMPSIRWVQSSWAGVTPLIESSRRDYVLTTVRDIFGPQMSEYVMAYLLAHEMKIVARLQAQRDRRWWRSESGTLVGKRLGVLGTGSIGRHIAKMAASLGMTVYGMNRSEIQLEEFDRIFPVNGLYQLLENVDYLVSTLPHTPDTDRMLDSTALAKLPRHAYFINVGRSNVIDDGALADALSEHRLAGAAIDVFDTEPLPQDSPLWDVPNLCVTAHIAAISHPLLIVPIFIENYGRYVNQQPLQYVIDFDLGY